MLITFEDVQAAMDFLHQDIPGVRPPGIQGLRTKISDALHRHNDAALDKTRQHTAGAAHTVTESVDAKFQSAALGFEA